MGLTGRTAWTAEQEMCTTHNLATDPDYPPDELEAGLFYLNAEATGFGYSRKTGIPNGSATFVWSVALKDIELTPAGLTFDGPVGGNWGLIDEMRLFVPGGPEVLRFQSVDADGNPAPIQTQANSPIVIPGGVGMRRIPTNLPA